MIPFRTLYLVDDEDYFTDDEDKISTQSKLTTTKNSDELKLLT